MGFLDLAAETADTARSWWGGLTGAVVSGGADLLTQLPGAADLGSLAPAALCPRTDFQDDSGVTRELADRQEAERLARERREAAGKLMGDPGDPAFQILDDEIGGTRAGNQLSKAEFDRLCDLYTSISKGRGDLQLKVSPDEGGVGDPATAALWRDKMMADLVTIMQTDSGRKLLTKLDHNVVENHAGDLVHRKTRLALRHLDGNGNEHHGDDDPFFLDRQSSPLCEADSVNLMSFKGGTNATIRYIPGETFAGLRSDVTLFHEMIHALDMTSGLQNETPSLDGSGKGSTVAEQSTIGILPGPAGRDPSVAGVSENAYRTERAAIGAAGVTGARPGDRGMPQRRWHHAGPDGKVVGLDGHLCSTACRHA
jgi:hypothetical protein